MSNQQTYLPSLFKARALGRVVKEPQPSWSPVVVLLGIPDGNISAPIYSNFNEDNDEKTFEGFSTSNPDMFHLGE